MDALFEYCVLHLLRDYRLNSLSFRNLTGRSTRPRRRLHELLPHSDSIWRMFQALVHVRTHVFDQRKVSRRIVRLLACYLHILFATLPFLNPRLPLRQSSPLPLKVNYSLGDICKPDVFRLFGQDNTLQPFSRLPTPRRKTMYLRLLLLDPFMLHGSDFSNLTSG